MCCSVLLERFTVFNREDECEQDCSESGRRHRCLPPVSPYRCRHQAVLDLLFDDVWQQLVGWMKELVQRHWECCTSSRAWISLFLHVIHLIISTNVHSYALYLDCMLDWQLMKRFLGTWAPCSRTPRIPSCCSPCCLQCFPKLAKAGCPHSQLACSSRSVICGSRLESSFPFHYCQQFRRSIQNS